MKKILKASVDMVDYKDMESSIVKEALPKKKGTEKLERKGL